MLKFKLESIHIDEIEKITLYNCDNPSKIFTENVKVIVRGYTNHMEKIDNDPYSDMIKTRIVGVFTLTKKEYINITNENIYNYSLQCLHKKLCIQDVELFFSGIRQGVIKNINISKIKVLFYTIKSNEQDDILTVNVIGNLYIKIGTDPYKLRVHATYEIDKLNINRLDEINMDQLKKYGNYNDLKGDA